MKIRRGITSYAVIVASLALIFGGYFVVSPHTARAKGGGPAVPTCAFTPQDGRTIVNFPQSKLKDDNLSFDPVWVSLSAGTYKVSLMSWDGYEGRSADNDQEDEQWYVTLRDVNGSDIANSFVTEDLADDVDSAVFIGSVNPVFTVSRNSAKVIAKHAKLYGAYSADPFFAVCAAFDLLSSPTPTPTPAPAATTPKQCADGLDNDTDGKTDSADPACHSDGNATTTSSYDPNRDSENSVPVITRLGDNPVTLFEGDGYTDAGATAFDEEDGVITSRIVRGGASVTTTTTKGNHSITYNVTDSKGTAAEEVRRLVIVQEKLGPSCSHCGGGGGPGNDPLYISNEKITVSTSSAAVVITWDTSVSATSRVAFGTTSVKTLNLSENFGYATGTTIIASTTKTHSVTIENLVPNTVYYFRPTSKREANVIERAVGIELSTATPTAGTTTTSPVTPSPIGGVTPTQPGACSEYLHSFIKFGENNDRVEVLKLQSFLRVFEGFKNVPLSGVYDVATRDAVNVFQDRYTNTILSTWGLTKHTGYVYITTKRHINTIYCGYKQDFVLTPGQKAEIEAYKAEIEKWRAQGFDVSSGLSNVSNVAGNIVKPPRSAWDVKDVKDQSIKDKPKQGTTSEKDATNAVIEAFDGMRGSSATSTEEANAGKLAKIAAAVSAKIHPSRLIQLFLILILFIVGFLLYRSGSRQEDDEEEDDDIPPLGKPYVSPVIEPVKPVVSAPTKSEQQKQQSFPQKTGTGSARPEQSRITLDQLKDNLVLKHEDTARKDPTDEGKVIRL